MQRQSLGSPGRTSLISSPYSPPGGDADDSKRRESTSSSSSSPPLIASFSDEVKPDKPIKCRHYHYHSPEKFIHFIPLLLIVSFFVLYLSSHDPSPSDLAQFNGFFKHHPEKIIDIDEIGRINEENKSLKRSGAFAIRNLQEEIQGDNNNNINITTQKSRKLGDF